MHNVSNQTESEASTVTKFQIDGLHRLWRWYL